MNRSLPPVFWEGIAAVAVVKLLIHLYANQYYGFHRDEFLYLALGKHLSWGYWSNPPLIGWLSALVQATLGGSVLALRLVPALVGTALVLLTGLTARELGGGRYAQVLAAVVALLSPAHLRSSLMFMPVIIDIFFWAALAFLILRYLNTEHRRYLLYFGLVFGLSLLNKYSTVFFLLPLLGALLLTPYRRLLWKPATGGAALLALAVFLPNLIWQYQHGFPVITHMQGLAEEQLVHVDPVDFMVSQLLMNLPSCFVWLAGLWWLFSAAGRPYRLLGIHFLLALALLLLLRGKSYYTLGLYPLLMAAGSVFWEEKVRRPAFRWAVPAAILAFQLPILPLGLPLLPLPDMVEYCRQLRDKYGLEGPMRWEDGRLYRLPQDYADMFGWDELFEATLAAYEKARSNGEVLIYGEGYWEAGIISHYGPAHGLPEAVSFSDSFRLWVPDSTNARTLIYINDELGEDVKELFADIEIVGGIEHPYARERGTKVYLCRNPRQPVGPFWAKRVAQVRATFE